MNILLTVCAAGASAVGLYSVSTALWETGSGRVRLRTAGDRAGRGKGFRGLFEPEDSLRDRMSRQLRRLGMSVTADEYYTAALTKSLLAGGVSLLVTPLVPLAGCAGIMTAVILWYRNMGFLTASINRKNEKIREELPRFIRTFAYGMQYEKDILKILESYSDAAGDGLRNDLTALISEMRNGNIEEALRRFDAEIAIPELSRFVNALIAINRGDDQTSVLLDVTDEITAKERERVRARMASIADRIQALSIPLVVMIMITYLYVIGRSFIESMQIIF